MSRKTSSLSYQINKATIENVRKYPCELGVGKSFLNIGFSPEQIKSRIHPYFLYPADRQEDNYNSDLWKWAKDTILFRIVTEEETLKSCRML